MADEKLCPLLEKPCIRDGCKMWIKVTIRGTDRAGQTVTNTPPEQCAFVWIGLAGLKALQFPGPPGGRRPAPGGPVPPRSS